MQDVVLKGGKMKVLDCAVSLSRHLPVGRNTCFKVMLKLLGSPDRVLGSLDNQYFCVDILDQDIAVQTYLWNRWELPVSALWLHLLKPRMTVLDIGANKGYFSLLAAKRVTDSGKVFSYEPHPRNLKDIAITIEANGYRHWKALELAASSTQGMTQMATPGWDEGVSGWGSIELTDGPKIDVSTVTLDEEARRLSLTRIDLMKMDIEGHEFEAVLGAEELLKKQAIGHFMMETHRGILGPKKLEELFNLFLDCRYQPRWIRDDILTRKEWTAVRDGKRPFPMEKALVPVSLEEFSAMKFVKAVPYLLWEPPG